MTEKDMIDKKPFFKEESLASTLLKKGFWLYFFSYILGPLGYLIRILISNSVSVEEVGVLYSIISFVGLLSAYNGLGLTESLKYFIPQYYLKKQYDYIKTSVIWSLGVQIFTSVIIIVVLYFGAEWFATRYFHSPDAGVILQYFCLYFFSINIFQVLGAIFLSFQDTFNNKFVEFVRIASIFLFTWSFFLLGQQNIINYSWGWISGLFFAVGIALIIFFRKYRSIFSKWKITYDKSMLHKFWNYSLWTFLSMNVGVLLWFVDQQMVVVLLWPESAGYYANYQSLLNISWILIWPIFALLLPLFTEIFAKEDWKKLSLLQNFLYSYFWIFALSLWVLLALLWPEIATVLYGAKFLMSWKLLMLGAGFLFLQFLLSVNFTILASMGKVKVKTLIAFGVVWVNVLVNVVLFPYIWVYWAVVSTIFGWFLLWILSLRLVYRNCPIVIEWKFVSKNIVYFMVFGLVIFFSKDSIFVLYDSQRFINFGILFGIGVMWYSLLWLINLKKIKYLIEEVKKLKK